VARNETEHSPLSSLDEYMIHQYPEPLRVMYTSDARAYERYWFTAQDRTGDLFIVQGCGFYPNLDTADAYSIVVYQGQHTAVRAFRRLGDDRADMRLGPINAEVINPFREWRLTLDENEQGISYDIHWFDTKRAVFHRFGGTAPSRGGRLGSDTAGYESFGYPEGWVNYKGKRFELTRGEFNGSRDHHWGTRNGVGGPAHFQDSPPHASGGQWVEFKDWSIWGNRVLYNIGDPRPGAGQIIKQERKLKFDPESKVFEEGIVTNMLASGEVKEVHYKRLNYQTVYLRCGAYGSFPSGGTPDKDIWFGQYVGDDVVEGETYDLKSAAVRAMLAGLDDHHCVVTCDGETAYGIFEPYEPVAYEFCQKGAPGYSLLP
jgi:hypothetical protein